MKKVFTLMLGLVLVTVLSSCSKEDRIKSKCEDVAEVKLKIRELELKIIEEKIALMEALLDIDDDDEFKEAVEKCNNLDIM